MLDAENRTLLYSTSPCLYNPRQLLLHGLDQEQRCDHMQWMFGLHKPQLVREAQKCLAGLSIGSHNHCGIADFSQPQTT